MSNSLSTEELKEIGITIAWVNYIKFVRNQVPFGDVKVKMDHGEPTKLLDWNREVRFDKPATLPGVTLT